MVDISHEKEDCDAIELSCMVNGKPIQLPSTQIPELSWREFQEELKKKKVLTHFGVKQVLPQILSNAEGPKKFAKRMSTGCESVSDLQQFNMANPSRIIPKITRRRGSTGSLQVFRDSFMTWNS
mmetsp:Transcript_25169/g.37194  ORF Transcript_25169/g.37194 Transcript_25169/m.37194 type:complete len:124 (-) Transcript_25169:113-484(-)